MLVFLIFEIKYCLTGVLEQPGVGTPALNVMAIRDQRHANVSKQRTLLKRPIFYIVLVKRTKFVLTFAILLY